MIVEFETRPCWYDRRYWLVTAHYVGIRFLPVTYRAVVDDFGDLVRVD